MTRTKRIWIKNAMAIAVMDDARTVYRDADILVDGPVVTAVGPKLDVTDADEVWDASGKVVLPGFVNTHHHLYQTLCRAIPRVEDVKLFDWLVDLYEVWRHLTPEAIHVSALVGMGEMLLTGATTTSDHFYVFPKDLPGDLLDRTVEAAATIGMRFVVCRGSMSRGRSRGGLPPDDVVQDESTILADSERLISRYHDPNPLAMCQVALAPCSPFSVTPELMRDTAALARRAGVRLHTHLAETLDENQYCLETHGVRPLAFMEQVGWLGPDVWYAHGVHYTDEEIALLAQTGTGVAHCPGSNLRLGSGIARVPEMTQAGVPVGLAVDGSASNDASDMLSEIRTAMLVHRVGTGVGSMSAMDALWLATRGSAKVLGRDDIGSLEPGKAADLVLWDMDDIAYAGGLHDPVGALVFCNARRRADRVMVHGQVVVRDGRIVRIDESEVTARHNELAAKMLDAACAETGIDYRRPRTA
ncbi:MAG: 8-oxoguanine deaminase [Deltaproteobacteria bacterium]|nr:8-oxoguanine deaminase [Deltaproteobacteria bacterium]